MTDTLQTALDSLTADLAALPSISAPLEARLRRAAAALTDAAAYATLAKKSFDTV